MSCTHNSAQLAGTVPSGRVFVDGYGVGDVGSVVLRDRRHLAQDGMIVVVVSLSGETGELVSGPDIITRGFVYVKESESLMEAAPGSGLGGPGGLSGPGHRGLGHHQVRHQGRDVPVPV